MKYKIKVTTLFKKQLKTMRRRGVDLGRLEFVVDMLAAGEALEARYRNHKLSGNRGDCWECHIAPDWLLIYRKDEAELVLLLLLVETGTHSDLFA